MDESQVVVGAALSADVDAPTEREHGAEFERKVSTCRAIDLGYCDASLPLDGPDACSFYSQAKGYR